MLRRLVYTLSFLTIVAGISLFHIKYKVVELESSYKTLQQSIQSTEEEYLVLKAEWTLFNEPERLATLATKYLKMSPAKAEQLIKENELLEASDAKGGRAA